MGGSRYLWPPVGGSLSSHFPEQASGDIELSLPHTGQWKVLEIAHGVGGGGSSLPPLLVADFTGYAPT